MLNEIASFLNSKVSGSGATAHEAEVGDGHVLVNGTHLFDSVKALKESDEFDMNVLQVVSGVDYENHIEVNYMLASFTKATEFILKVKLDKKSSDDVPEVESVVPLFRSANFLEREVYDMNGVRFLNHPDHRRILCPEDWEGYPLRKDYKVQKEWAGLEVNPEHKTNAADHNFYKEIIERMGGEEKKVTYSWSSDAES
jgi:NADH-quinone oxidoreductase subunit C